MPQLHSGAHLRPLPAGVGFLSARRASKIPIDTLVIDHIEKPSEN
jgi:hypothetical protein